MHAEYSFCMQEDGGKIIPFVSFLCWARLGSGPAGFVDGPDGSWPSPAFWAGSSPEEKYQIFVGPRSAQHILGLSPAQFVGPAQPSQFILYIMYIILCFVLYIYIYNKIN